MTPTTAPRQTRQTPTNPDSAGYAKPDKPRHHPLGVSGVGGGLSGFRHVGTKPAELIDLAARVRRLAPSHRDPERWHIEKSEIVADLRRLARAMGAGR